MDFVLTLFLASGLLQQPVAAAPDTLRAVGNAAVASAPGTTSADGAEADGALPVPVGPVQPAAWPRLEAAGVTPSAGARQRPRAVEMSEGYHLRLTIHYVASFATLPLFVAEYLLGQSLYKNYPPVTATQQNIRSAHRLVALGVAGLFGVNTVTGAWNLWDDRKTPDGKLRRYLHAGLMFAADAGFVATGLTAPRGGHRFTSSPSARALHRNIALASMGTALASYAMMLVWRN